MTLVLVFTLTLILTLALTLILILTLTLVLVLVLVVVVVIVPVQLEGPLVQQIVGEDGRCQYQNSRQHIPGPGRCEQRSSSQRRKHTNKLVHSHCDQQIDGGDGTDGLGK